LKSKEIKEKLIPLFHQGQLRREAVVHGSEALRKHREEIDAEKMRQLYVAMTRARYRLYLPAKWGPIPKAATGNASAMGLFLARLGQLPTGSDGLYERLRKGLKDQLVQFFGHLDPSSGISYRVLDQIESPSEAIQPRAENPEMAPPPKVVIAQPVLYMHSFTSLAKKSSSGALESQAALHPPHDFSCPERTPHTLPSGSGTGNLLHYLIEKLPLGLVQKARSPSDLYLWVMERLKGTDYQGWEECMALVLFQAFHVPLEGAHGKFTLAEINPERWYREMEFLYPCNEGYLKGTVDCALEHRGVSYILDWKSNWLGPGSEYYHQASLEKSMEENCYALQAEIYAEAWRRYSGHFNGGKRGATFGGAYYIFLRGPGVVYCPPQGGLKC
jgi:exodeoxyribonuclease V beta subunit